MKHNRNVVDVDLLCETPVRVNAFLELRRRQKPEKRLKTPQLMNGMVPYPTHLLISMSVSSQQVTLSSRPVGVTEDVK